MKKFLVALTFALTLAVASTALAQAPPVGPKIGGDLTGFMNYNSSIGSEFLGRVQLNLNGDVNDRVSYAMGFVNWFEPGTEPFYVDEREFPGKAYLPFFSYGFAAVKNVGPAERIDVGAIPVNRSPLRHFEGFFYPGFRFTGAIATSRIAPGTVISLGVGPVGDKRSGLHGNLLADLQYKTSFGDFGASAAQLYSPENDRYLRTLGVRAMAPVFDDKARIYGEFGVRQAFMSSTTGAVYTDPTTSAIIGVNLPRLAKATGFDVAGEYEINNNIMGWYVTKNLIPGVTFKTEGDYQIGGNTSHDLTAQTSLMVSF